VADGREYREKPLAVQPHRRYAAAHEAGYALRAAARAAASAQAFVFM